MKQFTDMFVFQTIGADPEGLCFDGYGNFIPAFDFMPNTKDNPMRMGSGRSILADNAMVELCIRPTYSKERFIRELESSIRMASRFLPPDAVVKFYEKIQLSNEALANPMAKEFGCSEDYCIYDNPSEYATLMESNERHCGGHVHTGFYRSNDNFTPSPTEEEAQQLVKAYDVSLLTARVAAGPAVSDRHLFYGRAGMYRPKPYGFEYRSLSNFWLQSTELMSWLYDGVQKAFELVNGSMAVEIEAINDEIVDIVKEWDSKAANEVCNKFEINIPLI